MADITPENQKQKLASYAGPKNQNCSRNYVPEVSD